MTQQRLTTFSYVVLVLVGEQGAGAHDLVRMARQGRMYWAAADSQYYAEPKRLAAAGYLSASDEPGRTGTRTHYRLTDAGIAALRAWMETPARFPRIQHEPILRVLAADIVGEDAVRRSLASLRDEFADISARLDIADAVAGSLPHRERYLRLNHALARELVRVHEQWLDLVEAELGG